MAGEHIRDAPFFLRYSETRGKWTEWFDCEDFGPYDDIHSARDGACKAINGPRNVAISIVDSKGVMRDMVTCMKKKEHEKTKKEKKDGT